MKTPLPITLALALTLTLPNLLLQAQDNDASTAASEKDGSYAFGVRFASQFKEGEIVIDEFVAGFRDQLTSAELRLPKEAVDQAFAAWQKSVENKRAEEKAREGKENLVAAEAFLKENGAKEGVETTESGLQYLVLKKGEGRVPSATDKVRAHYHGTFMDGEVFDSSKERGQPFETQVRGVIKGWQEGLQLMPEGSSYRFFIHPKLAYGERGNARIPANSLLIFDVEMIKVLTPKRPQAVTPPAAIPPLKK